MHGLGRGLARQVAARVVFAQLGVRRVARDDGGGCIALQGWAGGGVGGRGRGGAGRQGAVVVLVYMMLLLSGLLVQILAI